ncbi:GNAT family protein [Kitasatospora sp. NPDC093558]|uniref:GNAT family N-acetyltransferase n=1 Tax=Kitasatospora sp. NPDC093558 TaxID=3155201 RepID=UPI00343A9EBC
MDRSPLFVPTLSAGPFDLRRWRLSDADVLREAAELELHIEPWNTGSLRTAERAGFQREGLLLAHRTIAGERRDLELYALLAADLEPQPAAPSTPSTPSTAAATAAPDAVLAPAPGAAASSSRV